VNLSPHAKMQLGRLARLVVATLAGSALVVNTVQAWQVRYPVLGLIVAGLEMAWREFMPVAPVPTATAVPAPTEPPGPTAGGVGG